LAAIRTSPSTRACARSSTIAPGYGGSDPLPGRTVAAAAADTSAIADALGVDRFAVEGGSGGGPHAFACGALPGERVMKAASSSAPPLPDDPDLDWPALRRRRLRSV
jgi:pimeloyl-ACP methyl ester carboxylesterase